MQTLPCQALEEFVHISSGLAQFIRIEPDRKSISPFRPESICLLGKILHIDSLASVYIEHLICKGVAEIRPDTGPEVRTDCRSDIQANKCVLQSPASEVPLDTSEGLTGYPAISRKGLENCLTVLWDISDFWNENGFIKAIALLEAFREIISLSLKRSIGIRIPERAGKSPDKREGYRAHL